MAKLTKQYQRWTHYGSEGWSLDEFNTLEEAMSAANYGSDFVITKKVEVEIKEIIN